jgi:hypothetical protein
VRGQSLHVEPIEAAVAEMHDEMQHRQLRSVGNAIEHALRGESAVDVHTVEAAAKIVAIVRVANRV